MAGWNPQANEIFLEALDIVAPEDRCGYLDQACANAPALRADVEALLAALAEAGTFLHGSSDDVCPKDDIVEGPGTTVGAYKLLEAIGEGGFANVFMAEQPTPVRRKVALKILKPGMDTKQVIARFEAERQALALMHHPHIASVFDGGTTESGRPYFVMELVRGIPITEYCDRNRLAPRQRLELFVDVCHAVQHAHQKGIIHRDLKPANILVTLHDGVPVVKMIDFGIAKAIGSPLTDKTLFTGFAQVIGTPLYMSPEQAELSGLDVDTRTDIYALGVVLYELLTGVTPFDQERLRQASYDELRWIIRDEEPPRPSTRISTLGPASTAISALRQCDPRQLKQILRGELDWIVMKALEKDRSRRYESAGAMAADTQHYLRDEPVLACPPSAAYRARKFASRHRTGLAMCAIAIAAGLVAFGALAYSAVRLEKALERKAEAEREALLREAEALVGQAHGIRLSRRPGQRFAALEALTRAAAIGRELKQPSAWFERLRSEAIAALALPDLYVTEGWHMPATSSVAVNQDFDLYARADDQGLCSIHRLGDHIEIAHLPQLGERLECTFAGDRRLGVRGIASRRFQLWDLSAREPVPEFEERNVMNVRFRDGKLALGHHDGRISVYDSQTGICLWRLPALEINDSVDIDLHPTKPLIAAVYYASRVVQIRQLEGGAVVAKALPPWSKGNGGATWSPDGRLLIVTQGDGGKLQQYSFDSQARTLRPTYTISGPELGCPKVVFNRRGDRFVCRGWNGRAALFDADFGRLLFATPAQSARGTVLPFDRSGERLGVARLEDGGAGLWSVADGREYRSLLDEGPLEALDHDPDPPMPGIHHGGRLVAVPRHDRVVFFDLDTGARLGNLFTGQSPRPATQVTFDGRGNLFTNGFVGAFCWPAHQPPSTGVVREDANLKRPTDRLTIGPPQSLPFHHGNRQIAVSDDGTVIAQAMYGGYGMGAHAGGWIFHKGDSRLSEVDPGLGVVWASVTPDGQWAAFGLNQWGVRVHNAATGECVFKTPPKYGDDCRFTPDGRWLMTNVDDGQVYAVGTWAPGPRLGPGRPWHAAAGMAVLGEPNGIYRLVEIETGRELARLEDPELGTGAAALTPEGARLVVMAADGIRVWELGRIRETLAKMGLDWSGPPHLPRAALASAEPSKNLEIELQTGVLGVHERALAYAGQGQWRKAIEEYRQLVALESSEHFYWYQLAALHLELGDQHEYRHTCSELLRRFGDTDKLEVAERIAKSCLLAPATLADLTPVYRLADRTVAGTEQHEYYRWFVLVKGLAEYRAGRLAEALDWLKRFSPQARGTHFDAIAFAVLAMAEQRLGRSNQAREALARAEQILEESYPDPASGRPFSDGWHDWLHARCLHREAVALVRSPTSEKNRQLGSKTR
jgi:serine/threonine protein kinase/tetratricopeptide (TPR) repeat protein/WD40 repeat protein